MTTLIDAAVKLQNFTEGVLTRRISWLENAAVASNKIGIEKICLGSNLDIELLDAALLMKESAGQINVVVHAVGIMLLLPHILEEGEIIESISLGAGNTGKDFDLETSIRVAEFKFSHWKGGAETIRKKVLFKDFFTLAEAATTKRRCLYVIGEKFPLKFLNGESKLMNIMNRNNALLKEFQTLYGERFQTVREYYTYCKERVEIIDVTTMIPNFVRVINTDE